MAQAPGAAEKPFRSRLAGESQGPIVQRTCLENGFEPKKKKRNKIAKSKPFEIFIDSSFEPCCFPEREYATDPENLVSKRRRGKLTEIERIEAIDGIE